MTDDEKTSSDPQSLDYRSRQDERRSPAIQILAGSGAWVGMSVLSMITGLIHPGLIPLSLLGSLAWLVVVGQRLKTTRGWDLFTPGVLIGLGVTCLLPLGVAAIFCGPWR